MKKNFCLLISFLTIFEIRAVLAQTKAIVPLGLSEFAAQEAAEEIMGKKVSYFSSETYYDLEGNPSAYVFTYHKGGKTAITEKELLKDIAKARKLRVEGEALRERGYKFKNKGMIKEGHKMMKSASKKMLKDNEFITVVVGATDDQPPVILMFEGLPFHYTERENAKELAMKKMKTKNIKYKRGFYLGGYSFLFECGNNSESAFVDIYKKKLIPKDTIKEIKKKSKEKIITTEKAARREKQRKENVNKQWENLKRKFQENK